MRALRSQCTCQQPPQLLHLTPGLTSRAVRAQIAGLPVSGYFYVQHFAPSLLSGAGNTVLGGGGRRLLADNQNTVRSLLQVTPTNTTTTAAEALSTAAAANAIMASNSGRKLLQYPKFGGAPLNGLQITYACAPSSNISLCAAWLLHPWTPHPSSLCSIWTGTRPLVPSGVHLGMSPCCSARQLLQWTYVDLLPTNNMSPLVYCWYCK